MTVRRNPWAQRANPWTPERVERLTALAAEGATGAEIAAEFGTTRSSVIGKIKRSKLTWTGAADRRTKKDKNSTARPRSRKFKFNFTRPSTLMPVVVSPRLPVVPSDPCVLVDLCSDSCRWPLWDDLNTAEKPVLFCNEWAMQGCSYCAGHYCMAYKPVRERDAA
jgi:hypothetical protein